MKKFTLLIFTIFLLSAGGKNAFSQKNLKIPLDKSNHWSSFYENNKISLSVRYADCSDEANGIFQDYYLLRLENKTDSTVLVDWHYDLYYNDVCKTCTDADNEFVFRYELSPHEVLEPDCENYMIDEPYQLAIFRSIINKPELPQLSGAEISNLTIYTY
jgi:hypothetical protein